MTFQFANAEKPDYLHFMVTGPNTFENVMGYMQAIGRAGRRLETWDVYQIAAEGSSKSTVRFDAIAYVDLNAYSPMTVFPTIAEAESWIVKKKAADDP